MGTMIKTHLQKELAERGMSQGELARLTGICKSHVSKIVRGIVRSPRFETCQQIADALGVPVGELFGKGQS
jgi:transcriptional regulator with XRE-family HTH domain